MTEQTNLFPQDAAQTLAEIQAAMNRWLAAQRAVAENSEHAKKLRQEERRAHAAWLKATANLGQLTLPDVMPATTATDIASTREARQAKYRTDVRNMAVDTLDRCGGTLPNKTLALYINQDAHGLVSLLEGDPRLEKFQSGREKNEQTQWRLRAKSTVAA